MRMLTNQNSVRRRSIRSSSTLIAIVAFLALIISACDATAADDSGDVAVDDNSADAASDDDNVTSDGTEDTATDDDEAATEPVDDASDGNGEAVPPEVEMIVDGNVFVDHVSGTLNVDLAEHPDGIDDVRSAEFDFSDGDQIFVAELTLVPEVGTIDWHTHPGPIAANVVEGEFTVTYKEDCVQRTYEAGESFLEWGHDIHIGQNLSDQETRLIIVPMGIPEGEPITQPVDQEADDWEEPC